MYSLFCIFIIAVISIDINNISVVISISFVVFFISTQEFLLLPISPPHPAEGRGGVSERLSGPSCQWPG